MKLYELIDKADLDRALEERLVNARKSGDGQTIYNYSDAAMFTPGSWDNPAVRKCRGLIVDDATLEIVARPWEKFFNYSQAEAGDLDMSAPVEVTDKKDGSLGILSLDSSGNVRVASRGSFESDQAIWATKWINEKWPFVMDKQDPTLYWSLKNFTYLVEIIYPSNKIVCDYGDYEGLVLLGSVDIKHGFYFSPEESAFEFWSGDVTEVFPYTTLKEALEAPPRKGAEGLCVRFLKEAKIVKIKQEDYLKAHAYLTNCTPLQIWRKVREGYILEDFLQEAPDEFIPLVTQYYTELIVNMEDIRRRVNSEWDLLQQSLPEDYSRKQLADAAKGSPHSPALFILADGKDIEPYLLKKVKPSALP